MFRKLFKSVFKLGAYSVVFLILAGVWDYTQQRQASAERMTVTGYVSSVSDRYGPHVSEAVTLASNSVDASLSTGLQWAKSAGVLDSLGIKPTVPDAPVLAAQEPQDVKTLEGLIVLASVSAVSAPETSLYPRARAAQ